MSTKPIKVAVVGSILFISLTPLPACAGLPKYDSAIRQVDKDFSAGRRLAALSELERLHKAYPGNPEVSALLIQTQCTLHEFRHAQSLISQVGAQARYPELAHAIDVCREDQTFFDGESALRNGDAAAAVHLVSPLYPNGPDPYRAGLILARAYLAEHKLGKAIALYRSLARRYPSDKGLVVQARRLQAESTLSEARRQLAHGHTAKAITLARPLYRHGPDPYSAGLILARAYAAQRNFAAAATVYTTLAKDYPNDKGLIVDATVSNVEAGHATVAKHDLRQLNASQRRAVFVSLGRGVNRLYRNFVTVYGSVAHSSSPYPPDHSFGIQDGTATAIGTFVASIQQTHRFAQTANMFGLNYYTSLGSGYSGEMSLDYSPPNTILAREAIGVSLTRSFRDLSVEGSVRHLVYAQTVANVLFGGIGIYPSAHIHVETGVYYVPVIRAYSVLVAPEWFHGEGNRTYLYLTAGETGEQLLRSNAILRTPGYSATLGETFQITHRTYLNTEIFYEHRSGLYDRSGLYIALTRRW